MSCSAAENPAVADAPPLSSTSATPHVKIRPRSPLDFNRRGPVR